MDRSTGNTLAVVVSALAIVGSIWGAAHSLDTKFAAQDARIAAHDAAIKTLAAQQTAQVNELVKELLVARQENALLPKVGAPVMAQHGIPVYAGIYDSAVVADQPAAEKPEEVPVEPH